MKKIIAIIVTAFLFQIGINAGEKTLQVGLAYVNSTESLRNAKAMDIAPWGSERGGLMRFGMYSSMGILRVGGYADIMATDRSYLGEGGLQLGIGCVMADTFEFALLGKAGFGGGALREEAGAYYGYGGEFSATIRRGNKVGFGVFTSHKEMGNVLGLSGLDTERTSYTSVGISISFFVADSAR